MSLVSELNTKVVSARMVAYGFFGLFIGAVLLTNGELKRTLTMLAFAGVAAAHWFINVKAVCPRCKAKLPQARFAPGLHKDLHSCHACQLDLHLDRVPEAPAVSLDKRD